jgi:hypothetical protein
VHLALANLSFQTFLEAKHISQEGKEKRQEYTEKTETLHEVDVLEIHTQQP